MITQKNHRWIRAAGKICFFIYLILLLYFLLFAELLGRNHIMGEYSYNLEPFREIMRFWIYREKLGFWPVFLNLAGNVLAFIPFGFFLPMLYQRSRRWYLVMVLTFLFSLLCEVFQLIFKVGSFDVDDLLLNTIGGIIGYAAFCMIVPAYRKKAAKR